MHNSMLNSTDTTCIRCNKLCRAGEGHFVKVPGKGWRVEHAWCPDDAKEEADKSQEIERLQNATLQQGEG